MSGVLNNTYNDVSFSLYRHTAALARLQEQVSTGSRVNRASDDPTGGYRVMGLSTQERSLTNYMTNIHEASGLLQSASTAIENMANFQKQAPVLIRFPKLGLSLWKPSFCED